MTIKPPWEVPGWKVGLVVVGSIAVVLVISFGLAYWEAKSQCNDQRHRYSSLCVSDEDLAKAQQQRDEAEKELNKALKELEDQRVKRDGLIRKLRIENSLPLRIGA